MKELIKPFVHVAIDAVDTVVYDPDGRYDEERFDRFTSFSQARDAALSCVEVMLHEADYDDEEHKDELDVMLGLLEGASSFEDLDTRDEYQSFLVRLAPAHRGAA